MLRLKKCAERWNRHCLCFVRAAWPTNTKHARDMHVKRVVNLYCVLFSPVDPSLFPLQWQCFLITGYFENKNEKRFDSVSKSRQHSTEAVDRKIITCRWESHYALDFDSNFASSDIV